MRIKIQEIKIFGIKIPKTGKTDSTLFQFLSLARKPILVEEQKGRATFRAEGNIKEISLLPEGVLVIKNS